MGIQFTFLGVAGSGKTVILLAKIIQLVQQMKKKEIARRPILLITCEENGGEKRTILEKNRVTCNNVDSPLESCETDVRLICDKRHSRKANEYRIFFDESGPFHFFIDDMQHERIVNGTFSYQICKIFKTHEAKFSDTYGWFMWDPMQYYFYDWTKYDQHNDHEFSVIERLKYPNEFFIQYSLDYVVRNTREISNALVSLRVHWDEKFFPSYYYSTPSKPFHMIHGPKPCLHVTDDDNCLDNIVKNFHEKYQHLGEVVAIVNGYVHRGLGEKFKVVDVRDCMSYEWPVVLGIFKQDDDTISKDKIFGWYSRSLYLAISRARVVAEVVHFKCDKPFDKNVTPNNYDISRILTNNFEIINHDDKKIVFCLTSY